MTVLFTKRVLGVSGSLIRNYVGAVEQMDFSPVSFTYLYPAWSQTAAVTKAVEGWMSHLCARHETLDCKVTRMSTDFRQHIFLSIVRSILRCHGDVWHCETLNSLYRTRCHVKLICSVCPCSVSFHFLHIHVPL